MGGAAAVAVNNLRVLCEYGCDGHTVMMIVGVGALILYAMLAALVIWMWR